MEIYGIDKFGSNLLCTVSTSLFESEVGPFWLENLKRRDHSVELGVDGMIIIIILEWILEK